MNEEELIRTLAAHAADAVVLLEKIWPDDAFPAKLCDRVDASDYFITNRGAVIASDLRVPFLAEQVGHADFRFPVHRERHFVRRCAYALENCSNLSIRHSPHLCRPHDRMGQETALSWT